VTPPPPAILEAWFGGREPEAVLARLDHRVGRRAMSFRGRCGLRSMTIIARTPRTHTARHAYVVPVVREITPKPPL
jgi:hypothetical protein